MRNIVYLVTYCKSISPSPFVSRKSKMASMALILMLKSSFYEVIYYKEIVKCYIIKLNCLRFHETILKTRSHNI